MSTRKINKKGFATRPTNPGTLSDLMVGYQAGAGPGFTFPAMSSAGVIGWVAGNLTGWLTEN
jgi:hypothetical protein